jgi:hypothetical protein
MDLEQVATIESILRESERRQLAGWSDKMHKARALLSKPIDTTGINRLIGGLRIKCRDEVWNDFTEIPLRASRMLGGIEGFVRREHQVANAT